MFPKFKYSTADNIEFLFLVLIKNVFKQFVLFSLKLRVNPAAAFHSLKGVVTEKTAPDPFLFFSDVHRERRRSMAA